MNLDKYSPIELFAQERRNERLRLRVGRFPMRQTINIHSADQSERHKKKIRAGAYQMQTLIVGEASKSLKLYTLVVRNIGDIADVVMWANSDNMIRIRKKFRTAVTSSALAR